ncbi:hypothetical protein [Streptomyces broussonetiae]|uniref:Uncharacterized protein n=1 Tax=Streptomyces broussonetiae TaxID=2686304 RepID=A0ABV5E5K7_9ACTN
MSEPDEPDLTPRANPIASEPATPEACAEDYADGADIRSRLGWKDPD